MLKKDNTIQPIYSSLCKKIYLSILVLAMFPLMTYSANDTLIRKNSFTLDFHYPIPESSITFKTFYIGVSGTNIQYQRLIKKHLLTGVSMAATYFKTSNKVLDIQTNMTVLSPGILIGGKFMLGKAISVSPVLKINYDFITFRGKDVDGNNLSTFNQQGISTQPALRLDYGFSKRISLGLNSSYEIVFQHFGNQYVMEDKTIKIFKLGIGITYSL